MSLSEPAPRAPFSYRDDPAVPDFQDQLWHVVMDDRCGLCARTARRIARADRKDRVRIVPLRSELGHALMRHVDLDPDDPQSWLLIREGRAYGGLTAALMLFPSLSVFYKPLLMFWILPTGWREALYRVIARRRYQWFGSADLCRLPDARVQARLVTSGTVPKTRAP